MTIEKSTGTTKTEKELSLLGEKSFLTLWSYPNLFKKDGKELCDFLVIFDKYILIFEVKDCQFPQKGKGIDIDWSNWYLKSIDYASKQINKAESYLDKNYPIFLDAKCEQLLPIEIPSKETRKIIRIVVARNSGVACANFYGESHPTSLAISLSMSKHEHMNRDAPKWPWKPSSNYKPFAIGYVNSPRAGFIHVLDDVTLPIIFSELDTIDEFVRYFAKKEEYIASGQLGAVAGEEELLGYYLANTNCDGEHCFPNESMDKGWTKADKHFLSEGFWDSLRTNPQYLAKKKANKISYLWDAIITDEFSRHLINGTLRYDPSSQSPSFQDIEFVLRKMASENRTVRRHLAENIANVRAITQPTQKRVRVIMRRDSDSAYFYLLLPYKKIKFKSYEEYRTLRGEMLHTYAIVLGKEYPHLKEVIGIATETPGSSNLESHDLFYYEFGDWTEEQYAEAEKIQKEVGILVDYTFTTTSIEEYPADFAPSYDEDTIFTIQGLVERIGYTDPVRAKGLNILIDKMREDNMSDEKIKYALTKLINQKINVSKV